MSRATFISDQTSIDLMTMMHGFVVLAFQEELFSMLSVCSTSI